MKKIFVFTVVLVALTGCQWQEKRAIQKMIIDHYRVDICGTWEQLASQHGNDFLIMAGLLEEKMAKKSEGIMGYALTKKYVLSGAGKNNQNSAGAICYGLMHVENFKNIVFETEKEAVVSFVTGASTTREWARNTLLEEGKQLRRIRVDKSSNGDWEIVE